MASRQARALACCNAARSPGTCSSWSATWRPASRSPGRGATYLIDGKLQATRDAGVYVWDFWWMAHQVLHLGNPWYTRAIAAPVGGQLGYHALMPLDGVVMLPVTLLFGPSASYNLLSILMPGLMCYAMYRAARLWLPGPDRRRSRPGAFFGLSSEMAWHAWYQLNLAAGALFLPLALEAAIRLRRTPRWPQAVDPGRCPRLQPAHRPGVGRPGGDPGRGGAAAVAVRRPGLGRPESPAAGRPAAAPGTWSSSR